MSDADCPHGLTPETCTFCVQASDPTVYVTAGGLYFHRTIDCEALGYGQRLVAERGGTPAQIESLRRGDAERTRKRCTTCFRLRS